MATNGRHLSGRFIASLRPGPPASIDEDWARDQLNEGERAIWARLSNPDRRHAIAVARAVEATLGGDVDRPVLAAALLHDCGKVVSQLRTPTRVVATLVWAVVEESAADRWADSSSSIKRRLAQYWSHPRLGAAMLEAADSEPMVVAWAREHHLGRHQWTVPVKVAMVLKSCDDD